MEKKGGLVGRQSLGRLNSKESKGRREMCGLLDIRGQIKSKEVGNEKKSKRERDRESGREGEWRLIKDTIKWKETNIYCTRASGKKKKKKSKNIERKIRSMEARVKRSMEEEGAMDNGS